jgi:hypothetical protein
MPSCMHLASGDNIRHIGLMLSRVFQIISAAYLGGISARGVAIWWEAYREMESKTEKSDSILQS